MCRANAALILVCSVVLATCFQPVEAGNGTVLNAQPQSNEVNGSIVISKPQIIEDTFSRGSFAKVPEPRKRQFDVKDFPDEAAIIVQGVVESFMNKQMLAKGEIQCLERGTRDLAKDVLTVAAHLVELMQRLLGTRRSMPGLGMFANRSQPGGNASSENASDAVAAQATQSGAPGFFAERRLEGGSSPSLLLDASSVIMEFGFSLQKVSALLHQILHSCLHQDGLHAIKLAAQNSRNISYVGTHLLLNGADVCEEMADARLKWKAGDLKGFGNQMGKALRKTVLSSRNLTKLPEGMPETRILINITDAFLESFFGPGIAADVNTFRHGKVVDQFHVDLHKCFGQNADLLEDMWATIMLAYAKEAADRASGVQHQRKIDFKKILAYDMVQIPVALHKCHLDGTRQKMLRDAFLGMGRADGITFSISGLDSPTDAAVEQQLAQTLKSWKGVFGAEAGGLQFGHDLGKLSQQMASTVFPEKYSVDDFGRLRLHLGAPLTRLPVLASACLFFIFLASVVGFTRMRWQVRRSNTKQSPDIAEDMSGQSADWPILQEAA